MDENNSEQKVASVHLQPADENSGESKEITLHSLSLEEYSDTPLPPAKELEHYERIRPGVMVEKFIEWVEDEAKHRRARETRDLDIAEKDLDDAIKSNRRGQYFAFNIALLSLVATVVCAVLDKQLAAIVPAILGCVSLAAVFIQTKK